MRRKVVNKGLGGFNNNPTYRSWYTMLERCRNPKNASWPYYGAKGIRVCERWESLHAFIEDMGHRPNGFSLDRIDSRADYTPENCRWADRFTQNRNRTNNKLTETDVLRIRSSEFDGMRQADVGDVFGVSASCISRVRSKEIWPDALT